MNFFKVYFQGHGLCHDLVSKADVLLLKQGYNSVQSSRLESAVNSDTAQSGR